MKIKAVWNELTSETILKGEVLSIGKDFRIKKAFLDIEEAVELLNIIKNNSSYELKILEYTAPSLKRII